jgi:UDP-N-acetylglucosamine--N-acetylmuramyl-(pentapeptide) pyrophosphoryl-undecaprenol N-acetylglucosamine transferase
VFVGFPEAAGRLPASARAVVHDAGNPIEPPPDPRPDRRAARLQWGFGADVGLVVLAFGGSQGSLALNTLMDAWLSRGLPPGVGVIWGTGRAHHDRHAARETARVRVRPYLAPIADAYAASDLAITRAGAMTTAELCAWGIPMYLVPLPTAAADHQSANARALAAAGAAVWVAEREATPEGVGGFVQAMLDDPQARERLANGALARARPRAADHIAERLTTILRQ